MKFTTLLVAVALGVSAAGGEASDDAPKAAPPAKTKPLGLSSLPAVTAALQKPYLDPSPLSV